MAGFSRGYVAGVEGELDQGRLHADDVAIRPPSERRRSLSEPEHFAE
jgi:hypothetical protein